MEDPVVIVAATRTPIGSMMGVFGALQAPQLGAVAVRAALQRSAIAGEQVDEVLLGNCLLAGQGQAPARQAALGAGLPASAGAVTLSKMCGSGMRAIMFAHDMLLAGSAQLLLAGGMESMTNAPYLVPKARQGYRYGHATLFDHMALDGLEDAYERGKAMGVFAEECVAKFGFSRAEQDRFAIASAERAVRANEDGSFQWEIAPVAVAGKSGDTLIDRDEQPFKARPDKVAQLKPAFTKNGTITAASSSPISDGAAALLLTRQSRAARLGVQPLARIHAHALHAQEPNWFTTAPIGAIAKVLAKSAWRAEDVDLWEINEAFAAVTMAAMREYRLAHDRVNVHGGACALGHPIGASGARIVVTLIGALRRRGLRRGIAALCIGGGEATALALEVL
ncbi:MAG TPA: acetyl-CoA C-acyltransferase [Burkholderiaceae bacterium]|nr:acetyl-CoA C-acyltransferase [Burkholderiaceae bacterium]